MIKQPDLFEERGRWRISDPETSREAALSINPQPLEAQVLKVLASRGPSIMEEISAVTGIPIQTISPRAKTLKKKGLIEDSGLRRRASSGRNQTVLQLKRP